MRRLGGRRSKEICYLQKQLPLLQVGNEAVYRQELFNPLQGTSQVGERLGNHALIQVIHLRMKINYTPQNYRYRLLPQPMIRYLILVDRSATDPLPASVGSIFTTNANYGFFKPEFQKRFHILCDKRVLLEQGEQIPTSVADEGNTNQDKLALQGTITQNAISHTHMKGIAVEHEDYFQGAFQQNARNFDEFVLGQTQIISSASTPAHMYDHEISSSTEDPQNYEQPASTQALLAEQWSTWSGSTTIVEERIRKKIMWEAIPQSTTGQSLTNAIRLIAFIYQQPGFQYNSPPNFWANQVQIEARSKVEYQNVQQ